MAFSNTLDSILPSDTWAQLPPGLIVIFLAPKPSHALSWSVCSNNPGSPLPSPSKGAVQAFVIAPSTWIPALHMHSLGSQGFAKLSDIHWIYYWNAPHRKGEESRHQGKQQKAGLYPSVCPGKTRPLRSLRVKDCRIFSEWLHHI